MTTKQDTVPLSQSSVSLRLANIQRRCTQLIESNEEIGGLSLLEPTPEIDGNNPYDHG